MGSCSLKVKSDNGRKGLGEKNHCQKVALVMKSGRRDREIGWPNLLKVSTDLESRSIREKSATDILKSAHSILKATKIIKS